MTDIRKVEVWGPLRCRRTLAEMRGAKHASTRTRRPYTTRRRSWNNKDKLIAQNRRCRCSAEFLQRGQDRPVPMSGNGGADRVPSVRFQPLEGRIGAQVAGLLAGERPQGCRPGPRGIARFRALGLRFAPGSGAALFLTFL